MNARIVVTRTDLEKLRPLVESRGAGRSYDRASLDKFEQELERAEIVEPYDVPKDVVTMNSVVRIRDLDSGEVMTYRLIFPTQNRSPIDISVLAPIGTALLGYRAGSIVEWPVPRGMRRIQILEVVSQPQVEVAVLS